MSRVRVHLATVCLERNRWGSRRPSLRVSEGLGRWLADGFDGIELWENHFLLADASEQARLVEQAGAVAVFNTYAGFADDPAQARQRDAAAEAVARLGARGVKYNLGNDPASLDAYRRNLLAWADSLPPGCQLLCECHPGTVLEDVASAGAFFAGLDGDRFGVIAHVAGDSAGLRPWIEVFGPRVRHLHLQLRSPDTDPTTPAGRERLAACAGILKAHDYRGSAAIEFTRGIGRDERLETLYDNALADLVAYREVWSSP